MMMKAWGKVTAMVTLARDPTAGCGPRQLRPPRGLITGLCVEGGRNLSEQRQSSSDGQGAQRAGSKDGRNEEMERTTPKEGGEAVHHGIRCDLCGQMPLRGTRYQSKV